MRILIFTFIVGFTYGAPTAPEAGLCEVCHLLVGEVQDLLTTKQTQDTISSHVSDACAKLPTEEKDVCNRFMKDHSGSLFSRLIKDLTPHEFCESLNDVCPTYSLQPEADLMEEADNPSGNPLECELCKLAVLGIDKLIKQNRSSAAINDTLEKFCDGLPDKIKDVCIKIEPAILKGITTGFDPSIACKFATLCSAEGSAEFSEIPCDVCYTVMDAIGVTDAESVCASQTSCVTESAVQRKHEQISKPEVEDTLECQICKFAVQAVDTIVGENRSISTINQTLENVCNSLPGELKDSCLSVEPDILKAILGGIDPKVACDFVKLCNDDGKVPLNSQYLPCDVCKETMEGVAGEEGVQICYQFKDVCGLEQEPVLEEDIENVAPRYDQYSMGEEELENVKEDARCELCKFVVQLLDESLEKNATLTQINNTLYQICAALPEQFRALCPAIIPQIEAAVAAGLDPTNTCIASSFCTETSRLVSIEEFKCETCAQFVESLPDRTAIKVKNGICNGACHKRNRRSAEQESPLLYKMKEVAKMSKNLKGISECELCKVLIKGIDGLAGENASIETVNKTVYEICTRLTGMQLQQACLKDAPRLAQLLKTGLDPDKTCVAAKFCKNETPVKIQKRSIVEDKESALMSVIKQKERHNVGDLACDVCEGVIELLDQLLKDNATVDEINQTLYQLCSGLPDGAFKDVCLKDAPQIMTAVENGFDPKTICTDVGLCTGSSKVKNRVQLRKKVIQEKETKTNNLDSTLLKLLVTKQKTQPLGTVECDLCEIVLQLLDQVLEDNATDEKINQTLYSLCSGLPVEGLKELCTQTVVPAIMSVVEKGLDPKTTCTSIGLCDGQRQKKESQILDIKPDKEIPNIKKELTLKKNGNLKDLKCEICKEIIQESDVVIKQNASIEKINETVLNLCADLPGALKDLCLNAAPQILQALINGVDPSEACDTIGLCSSNAETSFNRDSKPDREIPNIKKELILKKNGNLKDLKCELCKEIMQELDVVIKQNASIEKINETLLNLCAELPGALKDLCLNAAPQILQALINGVDPSQACDTIGLCSSNTETSLDQGEDIKGLNNIFPNEMTNVGDAECEICELLVQELENLVGQNSSDEKINATIYGLCNQLPSGTEQKYCLLVAPIVVTELEKGQKDPHATCVDVKLCTSSVDELENTELNVGDVKCDICELIIQGIDTIVGTNASAEKINATIYTVCGDLPGAAQKFCVNLAPTIVQAIEGGVSPAQACTVLKLCSSSAYPVLETRANVDGIKCELCELMIHKVDDIVGKNASKKMINSTVYELCDKMNLTKKISCLLLAPAIVKEVESGADPDKACKDLKLCTSEASARNAISEERKEPLDCSICARSLTAAYEEISGNYMKVQRRLLQICNNLPVIFQDACESLVQNDNGRLFKKVLGNYTPTALCEMAKCQENEGPLKNLSY